MAVSMLPAAHLCSSCGRRRLEKVVILGARRRFSNASLREMRYIRYALGFSRLKHSFAEKILEEVGACDSQGICDSRKLLSKVSALVGYDDFYEFIKNEETIKESGGILKPDADSVDFFMVCKRFPSILLGRSPHVQLYDENVDPSKMNTLLAAEVYKEFLPNRVGPQWVDPDILCENWCSSCTLSSVKFSTTEAIEDESSSVESISINKSADTKEDDFGDSSSFSQDNTSIVEVKSDYEVACANSSMERGPELKLSAAILDKSISSVPGLSKRQSHQLENSGFHTLRKLLHHFPRTYANLRNAQVGVDDGQYLISMGKVLSSRGVRAGSSFSFLEVVVGCEIVNDETEQYMDDFDGGGRKSIYLHLKKFFRGARFASQSFLKSVQGKFRVGEVVCVSGKVRNMRTKDHYEMREYNIDVLKWDEDSSLCVEERLYPIYPSKGGLNPDNLRTLIARLVQTLPSDVDPIPEAVIQEFGLLRLHDAYNGIHRPKTVEEADLARKRLIFDEFFYIQLGRLYQMLEGLGTHKEKEGLLNKYRKPEVNALYVEDWCSLTRKFFEAFPYSLTPSQLSAISEIIWDLKQPVPMNRLLQGDVGCGKTIVAFLACMEVIGAGYQAAFMVPTELLAIQHYEHLLTLLERMEDDPLKPSVALLTGSTPMKQSRMIREDLRTGAISMVIGTHSLISDNLEFSALRIAVVDEQHRFGVIQRGRYNSKLYYTSLSSRISATSTDESSKVDGFMAPHVLAMSATPIPRTLALALYGDMSLTQITDLPPGRIPVETCVIEGNSDGFEDVYKMMMDELEGGGRVYVVYPVIEQSEQLPQLRAASTDLEVMSQRFQGFNCGLLHGKMKGDEKHEALRLFRTGETRILLSTQVIEIGVDVPEASMMVVMNAERFGIAQLHQLRGRVGRGERKSKCIFLVSYTAGFNRLRVLESSSDGFSLANMDLLLRGPGDLLGKKQSGHLPEFPIARLEVDGNILQEAHAAALKILGDSHDLEKFRALKAELSMRQPLCLFGN